MQKEQIIEAIRTATGGTFEGTSIVTTLLGYIPKYDEQGRQVNADPNYRTSSVVIGNVEYPITKHGWYAYIWKPEYIDYINTLYMLIWRTNVENYLIAKVDLKPDYVKEYDSKKNRDEKI